MTEELKVKQIEEAVRRLEMAKLLPNVIKDFRNGKLNLSENGGILYWLNEEEMEMVKNFEEEYNSKVYHVIKNLMKDGCTMYSLLYVSSEPEEWEMDREDLREGYPIAYVMGWIEDEFGSIGIKPQYGGLVRTA